MNSSFENFIKSTCRQLCLDVGIPKSESEKQAEQCPSDYKRSMIPPKGGVDKLIQNHVAIAKKLNKTKKANGRS